MAFLHRDAYNKALNSLFVDQSKRATMDSLLGGSSGLSTFGAPSVSTVKADEYLNGQVRTTKLTITALAQTVVNGTEYQGTKIYDFPLGLIHVFACYGTLAQTTTSTILSTLNGSSTGALSLGTATASSTTLSSTMANLAPSTAFTSSATINVAGTAVTPILAAPININGAGTAADLYLNSAYATTTDVDADATQAWTGVVYIVWQNLGGLT